jgi:hypothetical protein
MTEPISTSGASGAALVAIASALVGQQFGPMATIIFAAFVGTLISLGEVKTESRVGAMKYVARYVLMAVVLAGSLAYGIEKWSGIPANELLAGVAFAIGWIGNRWGALRSTLFTVLETFLNRKGG